MASPVIDECPICENTIGAQETILTTDCQHVFHRACAVERMEKKNRTDCYQCEKPSAIADALERQQSKRDTQCKICENSLKNNDDVVITSCQHVFHRTCALERLNKNRQTKCCRCGEASAIVDALLRDILPNNPECKICEKTLDSPDDILITNCRHAFHRSCAEERATTRGRTDCHRCGHLSIIEIVPEQNSTIDSTKTKTTQPQSFQDPNENSTSKDDDHWVYIMSTKANELSKTGSHASSNVDSPQASRRQSRITTMDAYRSPSPLPSQSEATVYIDHLPLSMKDNLILEDTIANRIYDTLKFRPIELRCYSKLGVGYLRVRDNEKDQLLQIDSMSLNRRDPSTTILFNETLEMTSHIVINTTNRNDCPSAEDLSRQWTKTYPGEELQKCEVVNGIFPNIFRITSTSFDQLLNVLSNPDFSIKGNYARVFLDSNCSYFEDLPKSADDTSLRQAIGHKIGESNLSPLDLHLEFDQSKKNVCIIAADIARGWLTHSSLYLRDKLLMKKENFTCRLLLHPVPENVDTNAIVNHPTFAGKATLSKRRETNVILEISDKNIFDDSLRIGVIRVKDQMVILMTIYVPFTDPEHNEIDANTWYEKEMHQYPANILTFIDNLEHPIFHYKWNPQSWIEQFQLTASQNRSDRSGKSSSFNDQRHKLRVTVMLNTIGTIRKKKYQINEREFDLHLNPNLKTIVYNHQSKLQLVPSTAVPTIPYPQTVIKVENKDCLLVYEELVKQGKRPVILNMASATSPGGGYRKGDGAQEENLFRRSDYFRSLDVELDRIMNNRNSERGYCTSAADFDTRNFILEKMYPMDKYGAIYTSGLTVFRQPENTGYAFMEKPLTNVCAIAMAAYREPKLIDGNQLTNKCVIGMRKKIENIFAIAHHHKHDCLILSAMGCGAYRNPPDHVAKIFQSVIEQYGGFFEEIIFAIIDDHNTGHNLNPQGNFLPFQRQLNQLVVKASIPIPQPNTVFGPYRFLDNGTTVSDVFICDILPCQYGAHCNKMDSLDHKREYSHPPWCRKISSTEQCTQIDDIHHLSFIHRKPCEYGVQCRKIHEKEHSQQFDHPPFCPKGGACSDTTDDHEKTYRHLPLCKESHQCTEYEKSESHREAFRHCKPRCKNDSFCTDFHNRAHMEQYDHPFPPPCPWTPYNCKFHDMLIQTRDSGTLPIQVQRHCLQYAHVCRYGRDCHDRSPLHWKKSIHVPRFPCPFGDKCNKLMEEDHLNSFTHQKIHDIRRHCKHADKCYTRSDSQHIALYRHGMTFGDSGVISSHGLNERINFIRNQKNNIARVIRYMTEERWERATSIPKDIIRWIRTVQPVHRCQLHIFQSILCQGHVMSREHMTKLEEIKPTVESVFQQCQIRQIQVLQDEYYRKYAYEYVNALVTEVYSKCKFLATNPRHAVYSTPAATEKLIEERRNILSTVIHSNDMRVLHDITIVIAKTSYELQSKPSGIGYLPDEALKTNKQVFSVLGPHLESGYGNIVIVFKREILHHPDANFSIQAATSYFSGKTFKWRPWLGNDPETQDERVKFFHSSKLHASIPGYEYATALELIALTNRVLKLKKKTMNITLDQILQWWCGADSHQVIEAHLPQLIPLDYIDHIYMPQNIWESLGTHMQGYVGYIFKDRFTIKQCQTDVEYNKFVCQELIIPFWKRDPHSIPRPIQGTIITIQSTTFAAHCLLPLTISQAFEQYQIDNAKASKDHSTYIYWQAMNGDMMLTLSKEQTNPSTTDKSQHYLICYLAKKPAAIDTDDRYYTEESSYLNVGLPVQHKHFLSTNQFHARSRSFYVGCNTDDFMTFCLEIQYSTGSVILSHAGPNSIYNHETISCKFNKKEMDLSELNYLYVSAGEHTVPVRNLIISFEKQADLHPVIDTEFGRKSMNQTKTDAHVKSDSKDNDAPSTNNPDEQPPKSPGILSRMGDAIKGTASGLKDSVVDFFSNNTDSSLKACPDSIYCLQQFSKDSDDHNQKYSHPCRFAEMCNKSESNLTHEPRQMPQCHHDRNCPKLCDPIHRANYRHTGLPYFLIPCRYQNHCSNKSDEHRKTYFHGEQLPKTIQSTIQDSPRNQDNHRK